MDCWWIQSGGTRSDGIGQTAWRSVRHDSEYLIFCRIFNSSSFSFYNYLVYRNFREMVNELLSCIVMCVWIMIGFIDLRNRIDLGNKSLISLSDLAAMFPRASGTIMDNSSHVSSQLYASLP